MITVTAAGRELFFKLIHWERVVSIILLTCAPLLDTPRLVGS